MPTAPPPQAEVHQVSQEAVAALILPLLQAAWDLLDFDRLEETLPRFRDAVQAVVNHYGQAASAMAAQHFKAVRSRAGVPGRVSIPAVSPIPDGFVDQMVAEAVAVAMEDVETARGDLDAAAEQLVLDQGRKQMMTAAALDDAARGWARIPNAGACSFCLMLALRASNGLLYTSKAAATMNRRSRRNAARPDQPFKGAGAFKAHDNCRCTVEPVFGRYEATAQVREAQKTWDEVTKGRTGKDARAAFRQAVEGREVTGDKKSKGVKRGPVKGEGKTPENQRHQLRVLEAMPPAKTPEAAAWRANRIAEIRKYLGE